MDEEKPKLWLCRHCMVLVSPSASLQAPRHRHPVEPLRNQMGAVLREPEPGTRAWRAAGWDAEGNLWAMRCDRQSGANLQKSERGDSAYTVEIAPVEIADLLRRR